MRGKKTYLGDSQCGIARALDVIGDWWSLLIVRDAFRGLKRFGEFQANLGLARNILSTRLKKLVEQQILEMIPDPLGSNYSVYVLTKRGESLGVVLVALWQWGEANCFSEDQLQLELVAKQSDMPLARLSLSTIDGQALLPNGYKSRPRTKKDMPDSAP